MLHSIQVVLHHSLKRDKTKGEVVPVLNDHAMKTYGGVEVYLHAFLLSALDG
jgi:hypothetical protein